MQRFCRLIRRSCVYVAQTSISTNAPIMRFYKYVTIAHRGSTDDLTEPAYEILLDKRRLRTPSGKVFSVPHEGLALAVAHEWDYQKETIERYSMPLTTLCNTVIDNPTQRDKDTFVQGIMEFADADTICCRVENPEELRQEQEEKWDRVLGFIEKQYYFRPPVTSSISLPTLPQDFREFIFRHILSYNRWGLIGFQTCAETLKSVWLTLAMVDGFISSEEAVSLSRLEQIFQENRWGSVPWFHGVEAADLNTRVAAGLILILTSHARETVKQKQPTNQSLTS
uniref:ATP synthase mitochondrial F1 complex assembly factor 2 n=1 Tax=Schistocephalus solidus TaxID=70667 RepID=A0A0X3PEM4_SCHSO